MSETNGDTGSQPGVESVDQARRGVEQVESGKTEGVEQIERAEKIDPAGVEAVEQEASDGLAGRGVSR